MGVLIHALFPNKKKEKNDTFFLFLFLWGIPSDRTTFWIRPTSYGIDILMCIPPLKSIQRGVDGWAYHTLKSVKK